MSLIKSKNICLFCTHFKNTPEYLETAYKGLTALSSAYGSVRKDDGICDKNDEYLSAYDWCGYFEKAPQQATVKG